MRSFLIILTLIFDIHANGQSAEYFIKKGNENIYKSSLKEAIQVYSSGIHLHPFSTKLYIERGKAYYFLSNGQGNFNNDKILAIRDFSEAIRLDSNIQEGYFWRGDTKRLLEDFRGAILDLNKAMEIDSNSMSYEIYHYRGLCKAALKEYLDAIKDFNIAIQIIPNNPNLFLERGKAKILVNDINGGCLDLSKAGELGSSQAYEAIKELCH